MYSNLFSVGLFETDMEAYLEMYLGDTLVATKEHYSKFPVWIACKSQEDLHAILMQVLHVAATQGLSRGDAKCALALLADYVNTRNEIEECN